MMRHNHTIMKKIKKKLKVWMVENGETNASLARKLGLTPNYIGLVANLKQIPSVQVAKRLEEATGREVLAIELLNLEPGVSSLSLET